ncbi:MAG: beta-propeller fold lactonase family protein [Solirubrobacteraceae bacterium]
MRLLTQKWLGRLLLGLVVVAAIPATAAAEPSHTSRVVGHVYVDDNTTGVNTIAAFDRRADGSLTAEPGSPFTAGGAGTGSGLASQGAIQLSSDRRFVIAVDPGSNEISVLRIEWDGALRLVPNGVVPSGGAMPVSVAVHGDVIYVANAGPGDTNYSGFRLSEWGVLRPIPGATIALPSDAQPGDVLFNADGTRLVGTRVGTSQIDSFTIDHAGRAVAAPGSPFPAQGLGPFGSEFRPTDPDQLFVSNAHNVGAGTGTVSAFNDAPDGTLTPIGSSPFGDLQTAPCWVEISPDGRHLFTVNTASGTLSRYAIKRDGTLALLGSTPIRGTGGVGAVDARLSPDGRWLFVDESSAHAVGAFAVDGGNLTELAGSPTALPAGAAPAGVAVN